MEFVNTAFDDLIMSEETKRGGRMGRSRRRHPNDGTKEFISKNLETERRRREKLSSRLLKLRAAVPIITDAMIPKLTIIFSSLF